MREAIIIGGIIGLFFFAESAVLTALAIKNSTSSILWDVVLWGGITGMILSVVALGYYVISRIYGLPFLGPTVIGSLGICAFVAAGIWIATAQTSKDATFAINAPQTKRPAQFPERAKLGGNVTAYWPQPRWRGGRLFVKK